MSSFLAVGLDRAKGFLAGYGLEPDNHADLVTELEQVMDEAALEAGRQVLREHGLGWVLDGDQHPPTNTGSNLSQVKGGDVR